MPVLEQVLRWRLLAERWGAQTGLSPSLVLAVIHQESGGKDRALRFEPVYLSSRITGNSEWERRIREHGWDPRNVASSYGLMQLMFPTAWGYGCRAPEDLYDPERNVRYGCAHLAAMRKHAHGDTGAALAAYNGGSGAVSSYLQGLGSAPARYARSVLALEMFYRKALGG
jgi:soluble lytic murein transglycosylase-like protein